MQAKRLSQSENQQLQTTPYQKPEQSNIDNLKN